MSSSGSGKGLGPTREGWPPMTYMYLCAYACVYYMYTYSVIRIWRETERERQRQKGKDLNTRLSSVSPRPMRRGSSEVSP